MNSETITAIMKILKRFSFQGICDIAILQFPETSLNKIRRKYRTLTKTCVMHEILLLLKRLTEKERKFRFSKLQLLLVNDLKNKTWYAWRLHSFAPFVEPRDLIYKLQECLEEQWIYADVEIIPLTQKYLIRITKRRNRFGELKYQTSIAFQYYFNQPYLFCGRKTAQTGVMRVLVGCLGYDLFKMSNLSGPKVHYLLRKLKSRDRHAKMSCEITTQGQEDNVQEIIGVNQPTSILNSGNGSHNQIIIIQHFPASQDIVSSETNN